MNTSTDPRARIVFAHNGKADLTHGRKTIDLKCFVLHHTGSLAAKEQSDELVSLCEAAGLTATVRLSRDRPDAIKMAMDNFREDIEYYWRDLQGNPAVVNVFHAVIVDRPKAAPQPEPPMTHTVTQVLDALLLQTQQRGGSPSVRNISDALLDVANAVSAYDALRDQLGTLVEGGHLDASAVMELELRMARLSTPTP